jgi:quinol-cytochrome oxidoreductase complex cytochrome b subunit
MTDSQGNLFHRIRRSILQGPLFPRTEGERRRYTLDNLIFHIHPSTLPERNLRFTHTWGLGGMSLVLLFIQTASGILLMFVYEPFPGRAYESIVTLQSEIIFGQLIRNIHHWSGIALVLAVFLHLLRVYFTGAFHGRRQFNWVIGLGLLLCVLAANFTGYLLPWDQLAFWAITIVTGMLGYIPLVGMWLQKTVRGGPEIGPSTILIFFTLHTTIIPVCLAILAAFHFWRVRKAGGVVLSRFPGEEREEKPEKVPTVPQLVTREVAAALVLTAFILILSALFNAPLGEMANPGMSPNPARAPWYFAGFQELFLHLHPLFAVFLVPLMVMAGLIILPYLNYEEDTEGIWFCSHKGKRMGIISAATALVATPSLIVINEFFLDFGAWTPGIPPLITGGFLPTVIFLIAVTWFYIWIKKKYTASSNEAFQALFILLLTAFVILTIAGILFRGPGMALTLPWNTVPPPS